MELFKSRTRVAYTNAVGDKVYPVVVDIKKGIKSTEDIQFVSSDVNTGILSVAFISGNENFNVSGADVVCSVMRPDASTLELPCEVVRENIVEVPLGINGTSQDGVYSFDFKVLKGGNKVVGTPIMNYSVSLSIGNDMVVEEDDRLPILTMLITQVNELKAETSETISQANAATAASREATANAIEATNNANAVSERVSQETATAISEIKQDTANAIASMEQNTIDAIASMEQNTTDAVSNMTQKTDEAVTMVNDNLANINSVVTTKVAELDNAKSDMTNTVSNKVNEVETRFNALTSSQQQDAEVIDARDGETSLKARLDRDIEKAKQVYVNVEGSNISTDSSVGYAKDVEILGNTIQSASNLADIRSVGEKVEGQELYEISVLSANARIQKMDGTNPVKNTLLDIPYGSYVYELDENFNIISNHSGDQLLFLNSNFEQIDYFTMTKNPRPFLFTYVKESTYIKYNTNNNVKYIAVIDELDLNYKFIEDKLTILSPTPLEKVGDVSDRIIEKDGVWGVEKNVESITFSGDEDYSICYYDEHYYSIKCTNLFNIVDINEGSPCIISSGKYLNKTSWTPSSFASGNECIFNTVNEKGYFQFTFEKEGTFTSLNGCVNYIKNNNLLIKVPLKQPQFIPLPHDQQVKLRTFANKTNISFLTEIEGTIKAQVPKSLGATVNTHTKQISNLNKELDRVKKLEESTVSTVTTESDFTTVEQTTNGYFEDVKLEGKTLVNLASMTGAYIRKDTGNVLANGDIPLLQGLKANTTYTRIINVSKVNLGTVNQIRMYDSFIDVNGVYKQYPWSYIKTPGVYMNTFTIGDADTTPIYNINPDAQVFNGTTGAELEIDKMVILEGDHTQNPPSYFEGLKSVGQSATTSEDGADEIVVSSVDNGNLTDGVFVKGGISISTGDLSPSTDGYSFVTKNIIPVIPNHTLKWKSIGARGFRGGTNTNIVCYGKNNRYLYRKLGLVTFADIEIPTDCYGIRIMVSDFELATTTTADMYKVHTTMSNNTTNLETAKTDKKRLLYYNEETQTWEKPILREWDSIEKHADGKYYYHKRSGEVVLNGSEDWISTGNDICYGYQFISQYENPIDKVDVVCDKLLGIRETYAGKQVGLCVLSHNSKALIRVGVSQTSVEDFKQWLQANNVTVVYQLAQEKIYECTNIDLITYANETNYVVNCGAIVPRTTLKVHNNISNVVKILQEKVSLLENKFIEGLKKVLAGDMYSLAELLYPEDFVEENPENEIMLLPFE